MNYVALSEMRAHLAFLLAYNGENILISKEWLLRKVVTSYVPPVIGCCIIRGLCAQGLDQIIYDHRSRAFLGSTGCETSIELCVYIIAYSSNFKFAYFKIKDFVRSYNIVTPF